MAYPILSLWLLVTRLGPLAYGQSAPAQENHTTPVDGPTSSPFLDNSHFAFSLYQQLVAPDPDRNVLFSPLSLSVPLTLLALQAKPKARPQILQDLGFHLAEVPESRMHEHPSQLLEALLSPPGACQMDTGSMLFLGQGRNPRRKFAQRARSLYRTEILATSFKNYRVARHQMDLAMEKKTGGKIKTFFEGMKMHSVLILANYIFFKGKWKYRFDPKDTRIMPFSVSKELSVPVPMMQRLGWFQLQYFRHLHSHALQVPCVCNTTALFILPEKGTVAQVEEALMKDNLDKWTEPFPLNGLNMFGYGIGLSGISVQTIPIKVSKAVHRVELIVDEEGTDEENVASFRYFPKHQIPAIHFNKPFLLLVYQEGSHNLLFMGKVINPNAP
ncbi:alpha-1-antitrypsin-like [Marmota flaviventris]|uniref:alpha-1-antitrypsin-like n=1 Tax=Marmota flaviventris TaxID=93162 RepID=UPI003A8A12C3